MAAAGNPIIPDAVLQSTFGPFVTGIMMQQLFLGVFCVQVYDYWRMFQTDTIFNRVTVGVLALLTVLQGTMDYINLYRNAVKYYGVFDKFDDQDWSLFWEIGVTALIGTVAQIFFLERCYSATKNKIVAGVVGAAIIASLAFGIT
ncbi:hypothetical protein FRC06_007112, partial [Ceratobasidium sp. 370]